MNENVTWCGLAEVVSVELLSGSYGWVLTRGWAQLIGSAPAGGPISLCPVRLEKPQTCNPGLRYNTADKRPER
jgi:hypothetical protein